ncbi:MAG: rhomboid family intramembrane serine protease [Bacteroidetes bacterium HGW-Bacteroidetes-12]|nr:MAG: rhomboid family intramembrane serine protease [Bacteroidetes bacterium HGW-Bacteroidetes-12]
MLENLFRNIPPVVKNILIINLLVFLGTEFLAGQGINITQYLALHYFTSNNFYPHQLVTYMFMHGGISHIFFNMFAVWMFGKVLEQVWGAKRFLIYYMATGVGAGLIQLLVAYIRIIPLNELVTPEQMDYIVTNGYELLQTNRNYPDPVSGQLNILINVSTVGASGAVFGILLAFGMLFPNTELMLLFPPIPIKAKWFVTMYGVFELYSGFANNPNDNVAHFAHLGGMLFGFILIKYWKADRNKFY